MTDAAHVKSECQDCGDPCGKGTGTPRRYRCPHCQKMVCGWCFYHVHGPHEEKQAKGEADA